MKTIWRKRLRQVAGLGVALTLVAITAGSVFALETGKTIEIKLGTTVNRSWADVKKDEYAYGPKQKYNADTKETQVWLPYGSKGVYFEVVGVNLTDPAPGAIPTVCSVDGNTSGRLVFKLHFDKPISAFRLSAGWCEWGVGGDTVGGVEYSVDGQKWTTIREINNAGIIEPFVNPKTFKATDLKAQDLYIRFYSRDKNKPEAGFGPGRWMKFWMGGDLGWGDISSTFFQRQLQLWVTPAE